MLTDRPIMTILPVLDLDRAREFYERTLGLREVSAQPHAVVVEGGEGARLELEKRDVPTKAEHTAITFEVRDLEHEIDELEQRGVRFEDYDVPGLKTERHIARMNGSKAAWFKDPDGNILCLHERV